MFWNTDDYWRTDASCKHQLRCLQNWRRSCMYVQLLFCTPTFTTQFTFTQFNNTGNNYLVLNIALISLNGKELYICMHILLKITQVFVIFASSLGNFGKYFSKICTLITQYFIYKNADFKILFAWVDRRHQGEEEKKRKKAFLNILFLIHSFPILSGCGSHIQCMSRCYRKPIVDILCFYFLTCHLLLFWIEIENLSCIQMGHSTSCLPLNMN